MKKPSKHKIKMDIKIPLMFWGGLLSGILGYWLPQYPALGPTGAILIIVSVIFGYAEVVSERNAK